MMQSRILLTGATGFIGRQLVQQFPVARCVVRPNEECSCEDSFEIEGLTANTVWGSAFEGVDAVIHLAGLAHSSMFTRDDYRTVNVEGTLHLAREAAKSGVRRFIFVSSIGVNGTSTYHSPFTIHSIPSPHNSYAQSKYDAELGLKQIAQDTGLEVVIVRPTLVYGPDAPGNFGSLTRLVRKVPVLPFGLTKNRRDFIAVQNLADLLIICAKHPDAAGHTFLASDGERVSIKEFTNAIAKGLGKTIWQIPIPVSLMKFVGQILGKSVMVDQLVGDLAVDSSNLQQVLNWAPPYTMEQAMAQLSENKE